MAQRGAYKRYSSVDRERVITMAREGLDWRSLVDTLGINYHTAHNWVRDDQFQPKGRGGSEKKMTESNRYDLHRARNGT